MELPASFYFIADGQSAGDILTRVQEAINGGAQIVQYREKRRSVAERWAREIMALCKGKALFIINDHVELAQRVGADGVHIGQEDMECRKAREEIRGIMGVSTHNVEEAVRAEECGADYIGVGPVFKSKTKTERIPIGLDELKKIRRAVSIPIVAIGGITLENAGLVLKSGADTICAISAVSGDTERTVRRFNQIISEHRRREKEEGGNKPREDTTSPAGAQR